MNEDPPNEAVLEPASGALGDPPSELSAEQPEHRTMPPPEWSGRGGPHSAASLALKRYELDMPVPHRVGPRAELATLSARLTAASAAGDAERERVAASSLSRALAARGTELELATRHARRSLLIAEDPVLREELAGWFASLGEPSLAAMTLRPLLTGKSGSDAALLHLRRDSERAVDSTGAAVDLRRTELTGLLSGSWRYLARRLRRRLRRERSLC